MKPIVLDCSVALSWCFQSETTSYTDSILDYVAKNSAIVPPLWLPEITNGLLSAMRKERIDWEGALVFLEKVLRLPIRIAALSAKEHLSEILLLAKEEELTSYDATYLYLAIRERSPLATIDSDLKRAGRNRKIYKTS